MTKKIYWVSLFVFLFIVSIFSFALPQKAFAFYDYDSNSVSFCCIKNPLSCVSSYYGSLEAELDAFSNHKSEYEKVVNDCGRESQCLGGTCEGKTDESFTSTCQIYNLQGCKTRESCQAKNYIWNIASNNCVTETTCTKIKGIVVDSPLYGEICMPAGAPPCQPNTKSFCGYYEVSNANACTQKGGQWKNSNGYYFCIKQATCPSDCAANQYCDGIICKNQKLAGETCADLKECLSGACTNKICACAKATDCPNGKYCETTKTCKDKKTTGAACANADECKSNVCLTGTCQCPACTSTQFCASDGICKEKLAKDAACSSPNQCSSGYCSGNKCVVAPTNSCSPANPCEDTKYCDKGICNDKKADGKACASPAECVSSYCLANKCYAAPVCTPACPNTQYCEGKECQPKKNDGEPCAADNECSTGACKGAGGTCGLAPAGGPGAGEKKCEPACTTDKWCDATVPICKPKIEENGVCTKAEQCKTAYCSPTGKCTIAPAGTGSPGGAGATPSEFGLPNFLGVDDPSVVIGRIIKFIMGFVGTIALIVFIYGGVLWLISAGRDELVTKGKNAMVWSAIGLVIVFSGYILVKFVFSLFGK